MWYEGHVEGFEWFSGSPGGWVSWWGDGARIGRFGTRTKQIRSETLSIHRNVYRKIIEATSMKMAMMMMMAMMMVAAVGAALKYSHIANSIERIAQDNAGHGPASVLATTQCQG